MSFVDESGRFVSYDKDIDENYRIEISRFRARIDRWQHTSPIAFVYDDDLREIAKQLPKTTAQLAEIVGIITAQKIGPEILSIVAKAESRLEHQTLK